MDTTKLKDYIRDRGYTKVSFSNKTGIPLDSLERLLAGTSEDCLDQVLAALGISQSNLASYIPKKKGEPMLNIHLLNQDMPEFVGQMIDIFEDFLDAKGIDITNPERTGEDIDEAKIFGEDYDLLADKIQETLESWSD